MSISCGKCEKVFGEGDVFAKCVDCKMCFHATCTRAGSAQSFTKSRNKTLKCDSCAEESKSNASARSDENEDKKSILDAIRALKIDINKNTDEKINTVLEHINTLQQDMKILQDGVSRLDGEQEQLRERCQKLEHHNDELMNEMQDLRIRLNDTEQHSRSANIEIVGLPMTHQEDIYGCLQHVATALGVDFRPEDISIAHRLRTFSGKRHIHPPIILQFVSRHTKELWMRAARAKRAFNAVDVNPALPRSSVFINEHLTPTNKALLGKARRLRREKKVVFAGFFNGKVLVKEAEGAETIRVTALSDLNKYEGSNKSSHPAS